MKFDDILAYLGEFGKYQRRVYVLASISAIFMAFQTLASVFYLASPNFRCAIPGYENDTYKVQNLDHEALINQSIPWEKTKDGKLKLSECEVFIDKSLGNATRECSSWVYDTSVFTSTALTEFNIVCGSRGWRATSNSIGFGGSLFGVLFFGPLSDFIGRKKTFFITVFLHAASSIGLAFVPNWIAFICLRFINGLANVALFLMAFTIGMELVGPSKRTIAGICIEFFWCFGLLALGGIAYGLRDWRHLQLAISVPSVLMLLMWWFIPESARWLLSRDKDKEAEAIIRKAAEVNEKELPPNFMQKTSLEETQQSKIWQMFTTPVLVIRTLIIYFNWLVVTMTYYGLGLNVQNLSGDIYLNFTIANIAETVSYVLCLLLLDRVGRRILYSGSMFLGGGACVLTIFPVVFGTSDHVWITTALSMIGKLGSSAAFGIIYVYSAELFPTVLRNSGVGTSSTMARIGGIVSPFIADLGVLVGGTLKEALPLIVFGAFSIAAGVTALFLPETLNRKLPENIDDAKDFGRKEKANNYRLDPVFTVPEKSDSSDGVFKPIDSSKL